MRTPGPNCATSSASSSRETDVQREHRLQRDVVVVGAGAAGLATARALHAAGVQVCVLEQSRRVAASWWNRYEGLRLNTVRWLSDLPFARMPASSGRWPDRVQWACYLDRYAAELPEVVLGVQVETVDRVGLEWAVRTDAVTYVARHVVVATGHDRVRSSRTGRAGSSSPARSCIRRSSDRHAITRGSRFSSSAPAIRASRSPHCSQHATRAERPSACARCRSC